MAFGQFDLVIDGEQQDGTPETGARLHLVAQGSGTLRDEAGNEFKFPADFAKAGGVAISLPYTMTLFTDTTSGDSTTIGYEGYVTTGYDRVEFMFAAPQAGSTVNLVDLTDSGVFPISDLQAFHDQAKATWARNPDLLVAGTVTRDANGAATSAPVVWPDGSPGTYTADTLSTAFPGAVDAYHITYGSPVIQTYTQPAITRDTTGAATNVPAIVVS